MAKKEGMSLEDLTKSVGYLRKEGGFSLTVQPAGDKFIATCGFKDIGAYGFTVSYAAVHEDVDTAQQAAIVACTKLVYGTKDQKPVVPQKAASSGSYSKGSSSSSYGNRDKGNGSRGEFPPREGAYGVSLQGLKDDGFQEAKETVKNNGFKWDSGRKLWVGDDKDSLPSWLQKRTKRLGGGSEGEGQDERPTKAAPPADVGEEEEDDPIPF